MDFLKAFKRSRNIENLSVDELAEEFLQCFAWDLKLREATTSRYATVIHPSEAKPYREQKQKNNIHLNKILDVLVTKSKGDFSWVKTMYFTGNIDVKLWLGSYLADHYPQEALESFNATLGSPDVDVRYHDAFKGLLKYLKNQQSP